MSAPDFRAALKKIPLDTKYRHHGRNPSEGLDCIGLLISIYELAGLSISGLDLPYGERDTQRKHRSRLIMAQLLREFRMVRGGNGDITWPVSVPSDARDGDVLLVGSPGSENHVAVVVDGCAVQMAGVVGVVNGHRQVVDGRIRVTSLARMWAFCTSIFRHQSLCDMKRIGERKEKAGHR